MAIETESAQQDVATTETEAPASTEPVQTEIEWTKPDGKVHNYTSTKPEGYRVFVNKDRKTWTASGPNGSLGETFPNKTTAQDAANTDAFPDRKMAKVTDNKVKQINPREHTVLGEIINANGTISQGDLEDKTELPLDVVLGVLSQLARRKYITLTRDGSAVTDEGRTAHAGYVAPERRPIDPNKVRVAHDRSAAMEAKYGPRPEGIGPKPSLVELYEARLAKAVAMHDYDLVLQRWSPWSAGVIKRVTRTKDAIETAKQNLEAIKNGQKPGADSEDSTENVETAETAE